MSQDNKKDNNSITKKSPKRKSLKSDKLVKTILSEPLAAREFLEEHLPASIKELIDIEHITIEKESYIDEDLKDKYNDLVYSVRIKGKSEKAFMYVLLEHQSSPDYWIAFRLWRYMLLLCERHKTGHTKLPLVYPIVLYAGKKKYTAPRNFWELFTEPAIAKRILTDDYKLINLNETSDDEIIRKKHIALLEYMLKNIHRRDIINLWEDIFKLLPHAIEIDKAQGYFYIKRLLWYSDTKLPEDREEELKELLLENLSKEQGEDIVRTIAQKYIEEGEARGEARGFSIGVEKIAINMLKQKFDLNVISTVTGLSSDTLLKLQNKLSSTLKAC